MIKKVALENILGKGKNGSNQQYFPFFTMFSTQLKTNEIKRHSVCKSLSEHNTILSIYTMYIENMYVVLSYIKNI